MTTDAERIDWLEANDGLVNLSVRGPHVCVHGSIDEGQHFYGKTFRDAIDAAMRACTAPRTKKSSCLCETYQRLVQALRDVVLAEDGWEPQENLLRELGELE